MANPKSLIVFVGKKKYLVPEDQLGAMNDFAKKEGQPFAVMMVGEGKKYSIPFEHMGSMQLKGYKTVDKEEQVAPSVQQQSVTPTADAMLEKVAQDQPRPNRNVPTVTAAPRSAFYPPEVLAKRKQQGAWETEKQAEAEVSARIAEQSKGKGRLGRAWVQTRERVLDPLAVGGTQAAKRMFVDLPRTLAQDVVQVGELGANLFGAEGLERKLREARTRDEQNQENTSAQFRQDMSKLVGEESLDPRAWSQQIVAGLPKMAQFAVQASMAPQTLPGTMGVEAYGTARDAGADPWDAIRYAGFNAALGAVQPYMPIQQSVSNTVRGLAPKAPALLGEAFGMGTDVVSNAALQTWGDRAFNVDPNADILSNIAPGAVTSLGFGAGKYFRERPLKAQGTATPEAMRPEYPLIPGEFTASFGRSVDLGPRLGLPQEYRGTTNLNPAEPTFNITPTPTGGEGRVAADPFYKPGTSRGGVDVQGVIDSGGALPYIPIERGGVAELSRTNLSFDPIHLGEGPWMNGPGGSRVQLPGQQGSTYEQGPLLAPRHTPEVIPTSEHASTFRWNDYPDTGFGTGASASLGGVNLPNSEAFPNGNFQLDAGREGMPPQVRAGYRFENGQMVPNMEPNLAAGMPSNIPEQLPPATGRLQIGYQNTPLEGMPEVIHQGRGTAYPSGDAAPDLLAAWRAQQQQGGGIAASRGWSPEVKPPQPTTGQLQVSASPNTSRAGMIVNPVEQGPTFTRATFDQTQIPKSKEGAARLFQYGKVASTGDVNTGAEIIRHGESNFSPEAIREWGQWMDQNAENHSFGRPVIPEAELSPQALNLHKWMSAHRSEQAARYKLIRPDKAENPFYLHRTVEGMRPDSNTPRATGGIVKSDRSLLGRTNVGVEVNGHILPAQQMEDGTYTVWNKGQVVQSGLREANDGSIGGYKTGTTTRNNIEANVPDYMSGALRYNRNDIAQTVSSTVGLGNALRGRQILHEMQNSDYVSFNPKKTGSMRGNKEYVGLPTDVADALWGQGKAPKGMLMDPLVADFVSEAVRRRGNRNGMEAINDAVTALGFGVVPTAHYPNMLDHFIKTLGIGGIAKHGEVTKYMGQMKADLDAYHKTGKVSPWLQEYMNNGGKLMSDTDRGQTSRDFLREKAGENIRENVAADVDANTSSGERGVLGGMSKHVTWIPDDIIRGTLVKYYMEHKGMTMAQAVNEVGRSYPDYNATRLDPLGIVTHGAFPKTLSMFMNYRHGAYKSAANLLKDLSYVGNAGNELQNKRFVGALSKLGGIGAINAVLYPVLDEMAKSITGDEESEYRRGGTYHVAGNLADLARGDLGKWLNSFYISKPGVALAAKAGSGAIMPARDVQSAYSDIKEGRGAGTAASRIGHAALRSGLNTAGSLNFTFGNLERGYDAGTTGVEFLKSFAAIKKKKDTGELILDRAMADTYGDDAKSQFQEQYKEDHPTKKIEDPATRIKVKARSLMKRRLFEDIRNAYNRGNERTKAALKPFYDAALREIEKVEKQRENK